MIDLSVVLGVAVVYLLSLFGYHWLATAPGPLPDPDLSTADNSVVLVRLEQLHPVEHRLDVKVLVMPDSSMIDNRLDVLTTEASVRFDPDNDLGGSAVSERKGARAGRDDDPGARQSRGLAVRHLPDRHHPGRRPLRHG